MPEVKPSALESMKLTFSPCLCFVCLLACFRCNYLTYLAVLMNLFLLGSGFIHFVFKAYGNGGKYMASYKESSSKLQWKKTPAVLSIKCSVLLEYQH